MADLSRTIQIIFEGVDNTPQALQSIGKGLEGFAGSVENATQPLADITQGILALDAAIVGLAAVIGSKAISETAKFEESLYKVQKQLGDTGPSLEQAREDIEAVALAYGTNANTVAESTAGFLAAGYDYETAAKLVDASTRLMIAGELQADVATKAITASLAGFKVPAEDAATSAVKIGDVLNKIGDISSGAFEEIVEGFQRIAPTAKDAGLSMEQTAAAIATIVDSGRSGEVAATALKSGLLSLLDPSKEAAETLKALGVATTDSNGTLRSANDILSDLAGKWDKLTESQKLQTAAIIFGKDQAGTLNALLGDWGKSQDYVAQMTDKTTGAVGSMAKEVEGKLKTLQSSIDTANEAWRQFLENVGKQLTVDGSYQDLVDAFGRLGVALKEVTAAGALDPLLGAFRDGFAELGKLIDEIAKNLPAALEGIDWSGFEQAIAGLGDSFDNLFGAIDLTTVEGLRDAIQLVIDVGSNLINTTSGIVEGLKPLFEVVGAIVKGFAELDPEVAKAVGYFLGLATSVNTVAGVVGSLGAAISGGAGLIKAFGTLGEVIGKLNPVVQALGVFLAAYELGKWISEVTGYGEAWDKTVGKMLEAKDRVEASTKALATQDEKLAAVAKTLGVASLSMEDFNEAVDSGRLKFNEATGQWEEAEQVFDDWGTTLGLASDSAITLAEGMLKSGEMSQAAFDTFMAGDKSLASLWATMDKTAQQTGVLGDAVKDVTSTSAYWGDALDAVKEKYDQGLLTQEEYAIAVKAIDDAAKGAGVNLVTMADQQDKAAKSSKEMAEASEKFALEWEKLLSAERIAIFEASADIQVAQIEADAERAKAAMEMLSESFSSTGEVLTELIGLWAGLEGLDQQQITEWIEREYEIREKLAQAQIDLVTAEIARMEAQTRLLERGGVELTIQSDGLEPDLEAFMFKIIDRVRVAVAGSYEEFLLGCGA